MLYNVCGSRVCELEYKPPPYQIGIIIAQLPQYILHRPYGTKWRIFADFVREQQLCVCVIEPRDREEWRFFCLQNIKTEINIHMYVRFDLIAALNYSIWTINVG